MGRIAQVRSCRERKVDWLTCRRSICWVIALRYFVPVLKLPNEMPPQSRPEDKLGGLPWGLTADQWPKCRDCGKSQSLLAQFVHDSRRLDLGRAGRVLSIFQCNHDPGMCATWQHGSGANACFVLEPEDLTSRISAPPDDDPLVEREARIAEWLERDDGIAEAIAPMFFSLARFTELPESEERKATWSTRLGSVPRWIQSPDEAPEGAWIFIGQLDSTYSFVHPPLSSAPGVVADPEKWEGRSHYSEGPNFGDGGIAYLFLRRTEGLPEARFFWQCG